MAWTCPGTFYLHAQSFLQEDQHMIPLDASLFHRYVPHVLQKSLTCQGTLSRRGVLSDEWQELILCLLQTDLTVPHSLSQSWLQHKHTVTLKHFFKRQVCHSGKQAQAFTETCQLCLHSEWVTETKCASFRSTQWYFHGVWFFTHHMHLTAGGYMGIELHGIGKNTIAIYTACSPKKVTTWI